jgi:hypothetical protein
VVVLPETMSWRRRGICGLPSGWKNFSRKAYKIWCNFEWSVLRSKRTMLKNYVLVSSALFY